MLVCSSVCENMYTQVQIPMKYVSMRTQVQILKRSKRGCWIPRVGMICGCEPPAVGTRIGLPSPLK